MNTTIAGDPSATLAGTWLAAPGNPATLPTGGPNLPPPNPNAGAAMRNRNWAAREQQSFYEMKHAPQPWEYTHDAPHAVYGGGSGTPLTQWTGHQLPPTGFAAQSAPVVYSNPGTTPGMIRPTYAYNAGQLVGAPRAMPTMYVGTWPNQYFPGGSNTYIPSWEATGIIIKYTRNPNAFRINRYVKELKVPRDQGYYLTLSGDDPYRVVSTNDYLWEDSVDAPGGRQERQGFAYQPYRTARYCYPFSLGRKSVVQAEWPILAEHAAMAAAKAMTVRTLLNTTLATTSANWTGSWGTNASAATHSYTTSGVNTQNAPPYLQIDLNTALIAIEQASGGIITDEASLQLVMNPQEARGFGQSDEYRGYVRSSPDALAAITDQRNPARRYGLAPMVYGLNLAVENAIVVSTPKPGNVPSPPATTRAYIWAQQYVMISSKPEGIVQGSPDQTLDFSTFAFRFYEQQTVEQKSDYDNRREIGRVVEDYCVVMQAPQTGYLLTGCS